MENLCPDLIRLVLLKYCNLIDAHNFAKTCMGIRRCFTDDHLKLFKSGVIRDKMARKQYHWSRHPHKWQQKKECLSCGIFMVNEKKFKKHIKHCEKKKCKFCCLKWDSPDHEINCPLNCYVFRGHTMYNWEILFPHKKNKN